MKKLFTFFFGVSLVGISVASAAFRDVPNNHAYADAINYAQQEGIVNGFSDGTFRPNDKVTRAALFKIIAETKFKSEDIDSCLADNTTGTWKYVFFPDVPTDAWYAKYVCILKVKEVINGDKQGNARPGDNIIFPEAAKVIAESFRFDMVGSTPWYKQYIDGLADRKAIPYSIKSFSHEVSRGEVVEIMYRLDNNITNKPTETFFSISQE